MYIGISELGLNFRKGRPLFPEVQIGHWSPLPSCCRIPIVTALNIACATSTDSTATAVPVFSERELMFTFTICCRPSVCRLSVTLVHPTQAVQIFHNISTALGTLAIRWHLLKI